MIPGFGITLGLTLTWLGLIVLIPLGALFLKTAELSPAEFWPIITSRRVLNALRLSFGVSLVAALRQRSCSALLVAWVLVRYDFPVRRVFDAIVDMPFALPTAVAGIALTALFCRQRAGSARRSRRLGIKVAYHAARHRRGAHLHRPAVRGAHRAAGARRIRARPRGSRSEPRRQPPADLPSRVILPAILPALLTGFALAFARAVGEYGSVIFIAGNMPNISEIAPLADRH